MLDLMIKNFLNYSFILTPQKNYSFILSSFVLPNYRTSHQLPPLFQQIEDNDIIIIPTRVSANSELRLLLGSHLSSSDSFLECQLPSSNLKSSLAKVNHICKQKWDIPIFLFFIFIWLLLLITVEYCEKQLRLHGELDNRWWWRKLKWTRRSRRRLESKLFAPLSAEVISLPGRHKYLLLLFGLLLLVWIKSVLYLPSWCLKIKEANTDGVFCC